METKNILVFPCGSECGLEIHKALQHEKYIKVFGASSEPNNPGKFTYENYISDPIPYISSEDFISRFNQLLEYYSIDFIFPALDSVALLLTEHRETLFANVISSSYKTNYTCRSKRRTYEQLTGIVSVPEIYDPGSIDPTMLPVFIKPDVGQGSQGTALAQSLEEIQHHIQGKDKILAVEYLPGKEYTVDCFTDRHGTVRFSGGRERRRIKAGIAVNSIRVKDHRFPEWAEKINSVLTLRGAWFFQVKENAEESFVLMEVACRIAGSSALARNRGINLPVLSFYDAMDMDVSILENNVENEIDRTFENKFRLGCNFDTVYCDFDDCLVIRDKVNIELVSFLYTCLNQNKKLVLVTRHSNDIEESLSEHRLSGLFDQVIHIKDRTPKSEFMTSTNAIFIDDSHQERLDASSIGIPVYSPCTIWN